MNLPLTVEYSTTGEAIFFPVDGSRSAFIRHDSMPFSFSEYMTREDAEQVAHKAYGARLNHIHLVPFLTATYASYHQTTPSDEGASLEERFVRTLEKAIGHASEDPNEIRRGPFALLVSTKDGFTLEHGFHEYAGDFLSGSIRHIIRYDGWNEQHVERQISQPRVPVGKAYLINLDKHWRDHQSYVQQQPKFDGIDRELLVIESRFGVYCNPTASTEEITWPV